MTIAVGQPAPSFTLPGDDGPVTLEDFRGRRVVLYFYPKDNTPGCTAEALAFRDDYEKFAARDAVVIGVSRDSVASHAKFRCKHALPYPLASDAEGAVCDAYGVWKQRSLYGRSFMGIERTTVLVDETGVVRRIWPKVKVSGHSGEVLAALDGL